jgi:hypothetical protein
VTASPDDRAAPAAMAPFDAVAVMGEAAWYPGCPEVVVCETHSAWVFLAGERAYKVKKPVRMAFLDFGTLERRRAVCHEEVRVNAALAASLDMRVRALVACDGGYVLADADAEDAVEYAIEMRAASTRTARWPRASVAISWPRTTCALSRRPSGGASRRSLLDLLTR